MFLRLLSLVACIAMAALAAYHFSIGRLDGVWALVVIAVFIGYAVTNVRSWPRQEKSI